MESIIRLVTVLLIFVFVLAITIFTTRFVADFSKQRQSGSGIEMLSAARLSQNQFVQIVRVGDRYHVLAVSKDSVTKLDEMTEEEYKAAFVNNKSNGNTGLKRTEAVAAISGVFSEKLKQAQKRLSGK